MNTLRLPSLLVAALVLTGPFCARADELTNTIKFSDPTKPGTLKVNLGRGELRLQGADTAEVSVKSEAKAVTSRPRKDGLRVLSAASSYSFSEKDNVVTVDAASNDWGRGGGEFRITAPRNTIVIVQNAWGGDITCAGISGDIEINSMQGEIRLDDVAGGVVCGTMNGQIRANIVRLQEGKPLSFTSMNGEVQLRIPENAKANLRLRTQNGSVLTDFDESVLVTKSETTSGPARKTVTIKGGKVLAVEIQEAIREATQLSATAVREALEAVRDGLEAARLDSDDARRQVEDAKRDLDRARRDMDKDKRDAERRVADTRSPRSRPGADAPPAPAAAPGAAVPGVPPLAPKPAMPTITGGKLVTGTLNGGGPEISVSTMNGEVIVRKADVKK